MPAIKNTDLILNSDKSIYHLNLHPEEIGDIVILVGDQDRVPKVSSFFSHIDVKKQKREFVTHTGEFMGKRMSVISSGIGTDNIDIVMNELDALVNVDFSTFRIKEDLRKLRIARIGTCGALQEHIKPGQGVFSRYTLGFDNLAFFYRREPGRDISGLEKESAAFLAGRGINIPVYGEGASPVLTRAFAGEFLQGITITCPGFYGPQGRNVRLESLYPNLVDTLASFTWNGMEVTNLEMETSALFALGKMLGHECVTVDMTVANRITQEYLGSASQMDEMIGRVLNILAA